MTVAKTKNWAVRSITCEECSRVFEIYAVGTARTIHCDVCRRRRFRVQKHAAKVLNQAIRDGKVKCAKGQDCVDCGKPARCLDHRNYLDPTNVEPVCYSCNFKRPPAKWRDPQLPPLSASVARSSAAEQPKLSDMRVGAGR